MIGEALEASEADVGVGETHQGGGTGGRGFVVALEFLSGLDDREGLGCVYATGFEHFGGEEFADGAFECEFSVASA